MDTVERLGRGPLEKTARLLVKRFRVEILGYGNPFGLPEGLMDRLERELAETTDGGASPAESAECFVH